MDEVAELEDAMLTMLTMKKAHVLMRSSNERRDEHKISGRQQRADQVTGEQNWLKTCKQRSTRAKHVLCL